MSTRQKSNAVKFLEELNDGPLTFGQLVESIRKTDNISQVDLARKMKLSRAHLCDIEKGRRTVSPAKAALFAEIMDYPIEVFVAIALEDQVREAGLKLKVKVEAA